MESSAVVDGGGIGAECGVGMIVWVRRRNGSWWPGRILGPDELSASHLMSPRSGTPVKLLGREDASVDWYNLEKSKRVKAFRCGEFDACIERAEASQGTPIKKREKYARREDAILHALELEKKQKLGTTSYVLSNSNSGSHRSEPSNLCSPESNMRHDENVAHRNLSSHKQQNILTKTDFSQEGDNLNDSSYANNRSNKQFRGEDDNSEAMPRMRGLQDFGLRTAQSKRKLSQYVNWQKSRKTINNHVEMQSSSGCMLEDAVHASSSKNSVSIRRKRSQSRLTEESLLKKRDRRRPLVQVLQSSAKLASHLFQCNYNAVGISIPGEKDQMQPICRAKRSRCVYLPHDSDESPELDSEPVLANQFGASKFLDNHADVVEGYVSSGFIEANDSDSLEADYLEPNMGEVANMLTDTSHVLLPGSKDCEPPEFQVSNKFRRLNDDEIPHSVLIPQLHEHITDVSAEVGVSKWHMKGKRNNRNIGKKPMDAGDGKIYSAENCNGSINETSFENKGSSLNFERAELSNEMALSWGTYPKREPLYNCDDSDLIDKDLYDEWRNPIPLQTTKDNGNSHGIAPSIWEADEPSNLTHSTFWEEPTEHFHSVYTSHIGNEMEPPLLFDVDLKVEASYQGEHVPLVSLMSRLNGKAIIGHPVPIEILESDSTSHLISNFDSVTDETAAAPPPMWRTGRRTAMQRVPRANPSTTAVDNEDPSLFQHSDHGIKPTPAKTAYSGYLNHRIRLGKRSGNGNGNGSRARPKKFQKKNSKRMSLLSQKTRTLSSFASIDKPGESSCVKLSRSDDIFEGLIKPEGSVPLVSCVPVKVVFSRLLEAVGKPSAVAAHCIRTNSPAVRSPS